MIASATASALEQAAVAGPYFEITLAPDDLLWRPFGELLDPAVIGQNVAQVRRVLQERTGAPLEDLDERACASIHALGLVSRLIAPALGSAVLAGHVPALEVDALSWRRVAGGPIPMAVTSAGGRDVETVESAADALHVAVIDTSVAPLVAAFRTTFNLSPKVLWGNVASSVAGAATMLTRAARPVRLDPAALAEAVIAMGPLTGMGRWTATGFVRNNCCLFYKIPGGGTCGDCVLAHAPHASLS